MVGLKVGTVSAGEHVLPGGGGRSGLDLGSLGDGSVVRRLAGVTAPLRARLACAGGRLQRLQCHFQVTHVFTPRTHNPFFVNSFFSYWRFVFAIF
jgi:hypothetical protein